MPFINVIDTKSLSSRLLKGEELFDKKTLDEEYLPRNVDVLSYIYFKKREQSYHQKIEKCFHPVALKIISIWEKCGMPTVKNVNVYKKIVNLMKRYRLMRGKIHKHRDIASDASRVVDFFDLKNIFNISKCQCIPQINSEIDANRFQCVCNYKNDLSDYQYTFLKDQVCTRLLKIDIWFDQRIETSNNDDDDSASTSAITKCMQNMSLLSSSASYKVSPSSSAAVCTTKYGSLFESKNTETDRDDGDSDQNLPSDSDPEYVPETEFDNRAIVKKAIPKILSLPQSISNFNFNGLCTEAMRYDTSYRMLAGIANRTLEMVGAITPEQKGLVITPSFLKYKMKKLGESVTKKETKDNANRKIKCFFFDGFTAKNLVKKSVVEETNDGGDSKKYENVVLLEQPGDRYLGFTSTKVSDADTIFKAIIEFMTSNSIDLDKLVALGCDGAATNVGRDNGIIAKMESYLQRPLHRIICLLHLLEVILRAVIAFYIGDTKAPNKYRHSICNDLENCEREEVVEFTAVDLQNMPQPIIEENGNSAFDWSRVTNDQKVLLDLSRAVSGGCISKELARKSIGNISEVRWTIYASRFLRLYMSTTFPTFAVKRVVDFIQKVYVPMLFWIKCYPNWTNGPRHVYKILSLAKQLNFETFKIVKDRVLYNSYFLHTENLLLAMVTDDNKRLREKGYEIILSLRSDNSSTNNMQCVRTFVKPSSLYLLQHPDEQKKNTASDANDENYSDLFNWDDTRSIHEPPILQELSIEQLMYFKNSPMDIIEIEPFPCHAQSTEFHVQVVKNIVTKYFGYKTQNEHIRAKLLARTLNTDFKSNDRKTEYQIYDLDPNKI